MDWSNKYTHTRKRINNEYVWKFVPINIAGRRELVSDFMERGLWPCGRDECDVSVDKREDFFISLSLCA